VGFAELDPPAQATGFDKPDVVEKNLVQCWQVLPIEHVFPNSIDPDPDLAGIGGGERESVRDSQIGRIDRHDGPQLFGVSAVSRGKTARGSSRELSPLGAAFPSSDRR
jgi:hypothetical protein